MLLPSAFPCEGPTVTAIRPTRPCLPSFSIYSPPQQQEAAPSQTSLASSCRALHTILGNPLRTPRIYTKTPKPQLRNPFDAHWRVTKPGINRLGMPRGANKRRREDFENDLRDAHHYADTLEEPTDTNIISTPKRRRRIPLDMPLGLSAADFQALNPEPNGDDLNMPDLTHDCISDSEDEVDSGYGASNGPSPVLAAVDDRSWTVDDDRILVETVLEKLQLSKRAWNDCARRLGKDKDSIGRRWKLLVDEREVGLKVRRGGPVRRPLMEVPGW